MADEKQPTTPSILDYFTLLTAQGQGSGQQPMAPQPLNPFSIEDWLLRLAALRAAGSQWMQGTTPSTGAQNIGQAKQLKQLEDEGL